MCRGKSEGGRRCPCSSPERRSSYRKAKGTLSNAKPIGDGGKTLDISLPVKEASFSEKWQPERMSEIMDDLSIVLTHEAGLRLEGMADKHWKEHQDVYGASFDRLRDAGWQDKEKLVRVMGDAVASEAERRAGVTAEQVHEEQQAYIDKMTAEETELETKLDELTRKAELTPEYAEYQKAYAAFNEACDNKSLNFDQRAAYRDAMREARDKAEATESAIAAIKVKEQLRAVSQAILSGIGPDTKDQLKSLSDAYIEVLSEVRGLGGEINVHKDTKKAAGAALNQVAHHFPSDWLNRSNSSAANNEPGASDLLVRFSKKRAHYSNSKWRDKKEKVRVGSLHLAHYEGEEVPEDNAHHTYRPFTDEEWEKISKDHHGYNRESSRRREDWEVNYFYQFDENNPPRGRGWVAYEDQDSGATFWRRPMTKMKLVSSSSSAELTLNPDYTLVQRGDNYASVASHEFTHRCEDVIPEIGRLERSFLIRRTTTESGEREEHVELYGGRKHRGKKELSTVDDLPDAYMGKDYGNDKFHEVMSTGVEAVFYGEFGGLVGAGRYKPDSDMRAFVLGVLASVGRK